MPPRPNFGDINCPESKDGAGNADYRCDGIVAVCFLVVDCGAVRSFPVGEELRQEGTGEGLTASYFEPAEPQQHGIDCQLPIFEDGAKSFS